MLPTLPPPLRKPTAYQGKRAAGGPGARLDNRKRKTARAPAKADQPPELNEAQVAAVDAIGRQDRGVPAGRRTRAGPGAPGAADGARNQPDAAAGRRAARPP
ncbi:hypothetical protein G6F31_020702 [Rhizopus arrhizus]|nr:hypothetical protein G6F31_020702 [Rhizopus arrhizus]